MVSEGSNSFWNEVKNHKWFAIKDEKGNRVLDPELQKKVIADYYRNLYSFDPIL